MSKKTKISRSRSRSIQNVAQKLRLQASGLHSSINPLEFLEHHFLPKHPNIGFEICDDHPEFLLEAERKAFVDFTNGITLFLKTDTAKGAVAKNNEDRFVIAHEIGHLVLHKNDGSGRVLSRRAVGSSKQYEDGLVELEANLFASAFLVPPDGVHEKHSIFTIRNRYNVSQQVAEITLEEAKLWRASNYSGKFSK